MTNTYEIVGDEALEDAMLEKTLTELVDDRIKTVGVNALNYQPNLVKLVLPNAETIGLQSVEYCNNLVEVSIPNATNLSERCFQDCTAIKRLDLPKVTSFGGWAAYGCSALTVVALRIESGVSWAANSAVFSGTPIESGDGYIYVPRALVDTYKAATNWSTYAAQFRALEDYTVDGTVMGALAIYACRYVFSGVSSTNTDAETGSSYSTTLAATDGGSISEVTITMGGVDITAEVYNAETGEINIPLVTGDLIITAKSASSSDYDIVLTPYNGSDEGELPYYKLDVTAGQTVIVTYFLTKAQGYVYDGRNCGLQYYGSVNGSAYPFDSSELNTEAFLTLEIPTTGTISFSGFRNDTAANGTLVSFASDRAYGKYIKVKVEG